MPSAMRKGGRGHFQLPPTLIETNLVCFVEPNTEMNICHVPLEEDRFHAFLYRKMDSVAHVEVRLGKNRDLLS